MLDLKTILVVALATAGLQALAWFFVWRAWHHLYEVKFLAAGFAAIALGLFMMIFRDTEPSSVGIVLHNTVIKLGIVLLAEGVARFLGQPRYTWFGVSLLLLYVATWSAAVAFDPGNLSIRIHSSTLFTVIMMAVICLGLMRDRTQPPLLRWITIAVLAAHIAANVLLSVNEIRLPADFQSTPVVDDRNAWYVLQSTLVLIALFACLLFMVSSRLFADLREKNEALQREVEERRRLEGRLSASLETERALRDEQTDFMRVVSHEFRTPLAVIRNAVEVISLAGDKSPTATRERLAGIHEALNRLFSLINRFMADDRENSFQPETLRIGPLMGDVQLHFDMTARGDRLHFAVTDEDAAFHADPDMLATIVINLIDNALKYSPDGQPITIEAHVDPGMVVIEVRDCGIGIPAAELGKVGRRFFRASNAQAMAGTGLGLYSARRLLAYHGGSLQFSPNGGRGTIATVRVPLPAAGGGPAPTDQQVRT